MKTINLYPFTFTLFISLFILQCGDETRLTYSFEAQKELKFPIDSLTNIHSRYIQYFKASDGKEYILFESTNKNSLQFFNFQTQELEHQIFFPNTGQNRIRGGISGAYVKSLDSIYINSSQTGEVALTNIFGEIIQRYDITQVDSMFRLISLGSTVTPMHIYKNKLYVSVLATDYAKSRTSTPSGTPLDVEINLKNKETKVCNYYPDTHGKNYASSQHLGFRTLINGKLIYSFGYSPNLFELDLTSKQLKEIPIPSIFQKNEISALKEFTPEAKEKNRYENFTYGWPIFDQYRNLLYRVVLHPLPVYDPNTGATNHLLEDRTFSVQIISLKYKLLGEHIFPAKKYVPNNFFVAPNGLYLSNGNYSNPAVNEDRYSFTLLIPIEN